MDPSIRTVANLYNEDQRWIGNGGIPIGQPRDIILDRSGFDLVTAFPNGYFPSGIALAKVAATGLYIPYVQGTVETTVIASDRTGGTFDLTVNGQTAVDLVATAASVTNATLQARIRALGPEFASVTAAGSAGAITITWTGLEGDLDVRVEDAGTGGTALTATQGTAGGTETPAGEGTGRYLLFASVPYDRNSTGDISAAGFWNGEVIESFLPTGHGVDAAFKSDCPHINFRP